MSRTRANELKKLSQRSTSNSREMPEREYMRHKITMLDKPTQNETEKNAYKNTLFTVLLGAESSGNSIFPYDNLSLLNNQFNTKKKEQYIFQPQTKINCKKLTEERYARPVIFGFDDSAYITAGTSLFRLNKDNKRVKLLNNNITSNSPVAICADPNNILFCSYYEKLSNYNTKFYFNLFDIKINKIILATTTKRLVNVIIKDENYNDCYYRGAQDSESTIIEKLDMRCDLKVTNFGKKNDEVINLSQSGYQLAASELRSAQVVIWDVRKTKVPVMAYSEHKSLSKGLAFQPQSNIIASGGECSMISNIPGSGNCENDRMLKVWDSVTAKTYAEIDTGGQIYNIHWIDKHHLVTTQGFGNAGIFLWRFENERLELINSAKNTTGQVLFSAQNPCDNKQLITGIVTDVGLDKPNYLQSLSIFSSNGNRQDKEDYVSTLSMNHPRNNIR